MSRKKPKVVHVVEHKNSGLKVEIKMNPDTLAFSALMPDSTELSSVNGKELARDVHIWLTKNTTLEWRDVIEVESLSPFGNTDDNFVGFEIERFHWAKKCDGGFVRCQWLHRPDDIDTFPQPHKCGFTYVKPFNLRNNDFDPPCFIEEYHKYYYIPHNEELWAGLEQMLKAIHEIKVRLNEMLADPAEGHAYLAIVGANILKALPDRRAAIDVATCLSN